MLELLWWAADKAVSAPVVVSKAAIDAAIMLLDSYFAPMVARALGETSSSESERAAAVLARAILERRLAQINTRDIRRTWRTPGLTKAAQVEVLYASCAKPTGWLQPSTRSQAGPLRLFM